MICAFSKEFSSNAYTCIENSFIKKYMPLADGDAVKVYLYGLLLCSSSSDVSLKDASEELFLTEDKIKEYFCFWEEFGLVSIVNVEPFTVNYLPINNVYSKPRKIKAEKYTDFSKSLQTLISSRMISTGEYTEYFNIMETYSIKPDAMLFIVKYCVDRKGTDIGYHYISKVAKDFGAREINTLEKIEQELSSYVSRTNELEKILKALSIRRAPDIEDLKLYKKWTGELNFDFNNILFAAKTLKRASIEKLDQFILELYSMKSFSKTEIEEFVNNKKAVYDTAIKINKALAIYVEIIDTVVDTYTKKWLSYGYDEQTLLYIASHLFTTGKNTLPDMDSLLTVLRERGVIDYVSVADYFENQKRADEFIAKILNNAGLVRRPTPWDRENLNMWKSWNFSDEMIIEAAKLSAGKSSPISYMNAILSGWKNKGVFSVSEIISEGSETSQEEYNKEYTRRRQKAISTAQKNSEKAMELQGFSKVYERLFSIEKDLAYAEISGNKDQLKNLENEKISLTKTAEEILSEVSLTLADLSPNYSCKKCNDTGYVGTHKCDCF